MIAILDYGIGNIASILNMLKKIGAPARLTSDPAVVKDSSKLILPGIGSFDYCMQQLKKASFYDIMHEKVLGENTPLLGVCVGCQMLMERSEEGNEPGLGWIKGSVKKFNSSRLPSDHKVPHMGWTDVNPRNNNFLYEGISEPRFYFVHSYHLDCDDDTNITATADYGYEFPASVSSKNIMGVQFHPEKSHTYGMKLYSNFVNNTPGL
jgi:glutamine amidotransferase